MSHLRKSYRLSGYLIACSSLLLGWTNPTWAQDEPINLLEIFQLAQKYDPTYIAAKYERDAIQEAEPQALAQLFPQADLSTSTSIQYLDVNSSQVNQSDLSAGYDIVLNITQSIYRRDLIIALKQAKSNVAQAIVDYESSLQDLIVRTATTYFNALNAEDNLAFANANENAISQQLEQAQQRFEVGLIAITGVEEARARFDLSRSQKILAKNQRDNARERLREITDRYHPALAQLQIDTPLDSPTPPRIDVWTETSLKQNLRIASVGHNVDIALHGIERARSGHYPTVALTGQINRSHRNGDSSASNRSAGNEGIEVGIQLNLPLYRGGGVLSQIREARALHQQSLHQYEIVQRGVIRQTRESFLGVESGIAQVKALRQALISNQSALDAIRAGFQVGTRTSVDVLDAQSDLFAAELDYASARYDYILDTLNLKQAAGTLAVEDLAVINNWLKKKP